MLTRCPTCRTTFRVTADQLMARRGHVRCGHCQSVFNALETLIEEPAAPAARPEVVPSHPPIGPLPAAAVAAPGSEVPSPAKPAVVPPSAVGVPAPAAVAPPQPEAGPSPDFREAPPASATEPAAEFPAAAVQERPVVIQGFEVTDVGDPLSGGPEAIDWPVAPWSAPNEVAPDAASALMGEEVAEPVIEYVELGDAGEEEDAATEVLISPDRLLDEALARTEINIEGFTAPSVEEAMAADETESPAPDPYTKTVVGFTWYVEPEPTAAEAQPAEEFAKTVVQSVRMTEPDLPSEPHEPPHEDEFARTIIAPWHTVAAEPEPAPPEVQEPPTTPAAAPEVTSAAPADEEFAKTVVQSVRMFDTEFAPEPALPTSDATAAPQVEVSQDEIETLTGEQRPGQASAVPSIRQIVAAEPAAPPPEAVPDREATTTVVQHPAVMPEHRPVFDGSAPATAPVADAADDDFAKTVVQSIRMFEPEPEPEAAEEILFDEFETTSIEPRPTTTPVAEARPAASGSALPTGESDSDSTDLKRAIAREFARSVQIGAAEAGQHGELDFDIGPIDDLHVEKEDESPSIVDLSIRPPTSFPKLETPPHQDPEAAAATANAILDQLSTSAESVSPTVAPRGLPIDELERAAVPVALAEPPGEPVAEIEDESATAPAAEAIAELQELPRRRRWPWLLGSVIAALLLALQVVVRYRVELSVLMPGTKPALLAMCEVLECKLPLPSQIDLIGIENSDLSPGPEGAGHLQLAATLRNRAPFGQSWPDLELTLTDAADKPLVRRTLGPSDYLPPPIKAADGFPARSEQSVHLDLKAPGVPAVGYRLYVFYP